VQHKVDAVVSDCSDFGAVKKSGGDDVEDLAGFGSENARQMQGLLPSERGVRGVARLGRDGIGNPAAASHKNYLGIVT
jgi:hypothetical protein